MAATFKVQICYAVDITVSDEQHKLFVEGDPAVAREAMMYEIEAKGHRAHQDSITSAAITMLVSLKNGPQKVVFQNETTKLILRG